MDTKTQIIISAKDETYQAFNSVKQNLAGLNGAVSGFIGGFAGLASAGGVAVILNKLVTETTNAANEQAQLAAVLESTGNAAGFAQAELNRMASSLGIQSIFSEGDITNAQTRLLSYTGIVGEQFPRAMQAVIDMSTRMGMSLEQSAETIGRALDIPSQGLTSLTRQGFRFTEAQQELVKSLEETGRTAEAQNIILQALETSYGGAAEAARNTLGGEIRALGENFNDLFELSDEGRAFTTVVKDLNIALEATKAAAEGVPFDVIGRLFSGYDQFRKTMDETLSGSPNMLGDLILPADARIDKGPQKIFDFPAMMTEGGKVKDLLSAINDRAAEFQSKNPLKDSVAKQEEYRKKLEEVSRLEREGGISAEIAARYRNQLAETYKKTGDEQSKQAEKQIEQASRFIEQVRKQAETFDFSKAELLQYDAASLKFTETQRKVLDGLIEEIAAREQLDALNQAWEAQAMLNAAANERDMELLADHTATELEERQKLLDFYESYKANLLGQQEELNVALISNDRARARAQLDLEKQRAIDTINAMVLENEQRLELLEELDKTYALKFKDLEQNGVDAFDELQRAVEGFGDKFADTFNDMIFDGKAGFSDLVNSILKDLSRLAIKRSITDPIFRGLEESGIFDGLSGALGSFFGGARAAGGAVNPSKFYLVGEKGPELFVPGTAGNIIPNDFGGNAGNQYNVSVSVDATGGKVQGDSAAAGELGRRIEGAVRQVLVQEKRPGGMLAR